MEQNAYLEKADGEQVHVHFGSKNTMKHLQQVIAHSHLLNQNWREIANEPLETLDWEKEGESIIRESGKMVVLDRLLKLHLSVYSLNQQIGARPRMLLYAHNAEVLQLLSEYLEYRQFPYGCLHASQSLEEKMQSLEAFNSPASDELIMLADVRIAGQGIQLHRVNAVVFYDIQANAYSDIQAEMRAAGCIVDYAGTDGDEMKVFYLVGKHCYDSFLFEQKVLMGTRPELACEITLDAPSTEEIDTEDGERWMTDIFNQRCHQEKQKDEMRILNTTSGFWEKVLQERPSTPSTSAPSTGSLTQNQIDSVLRHGAYDVFQ